MPTFGGMVVATGGAATDGRRTLLDVIDDLARPVNAADTQVRAMAADAFRSAVRTMNRKGLWPWELQDETLTQTVNSPYTTVQGAIKKPLAMYYLSSTTSQPQIRVGYLKYEALVEEYDLSLTGKPWIYTVPNIFETGQIRWYPIPTTAESLRFTYYRVTPAPRVESEALEIPDYAIEAYMAQARYEFAKRVPSITKTALMERDDARQAFRELSAHVNSAGDRA